MNPAFGGFYQNAYVTTDLARAIEVFRTVYGVPAFLELDADYPVVCRGASARLNLRLALANLNGVQIELIQPHEGCAELYRRGLPAEGFGLAHHHIAVRVEGDEARWEAWRSQVESGDRQIALEGSAGSTAHFIYMDDCALLDHYTEYFWSTDEQRRQFDAAVPTFTLTT